LNQDDLVIRVFVKEGSQELSDDIADLLRVVIPDSLSTPRHRLIGQDVRVVIATAPDSQEADIHVTIHALWDMDRWYGRKKRATSLQESFEWSLYELTRRRPSASLELTLYNTFWNFKNVTFIDSRIRPGSTRVTIHGEIEEA